MRLPFKQIKNLMYLLVICCLGMYVTYAMEQTTSGMEKKAEEQKSSLASLPPELKVYIINFLISEKDPDKLVKSIKALSLTSKEFYTFINDPEVLGNLILEISRQFNLPSPIPIAVAFAIPSAFNWLEDYIKRHHTSQEKEILNKLLILASIVGYESRIKFLLKAGIDINTTDNDGKTPLYSASENGHKNIVQLLVDAGADVNKVDKYSYTPLLAASESGHKDTVKLLLQAGVDINKAGVAGNTPLHVAARKGYKDIVELLIKAGANATIPDNNGNTPLSLASRNYQMSVIKQDMDKYRDIIKLLCEHGAGGGYCTIL
jgi:hypothetical protein